jgi:hypothetical protein
VNLRRLALAVAVPHAVLGVLEVVHDQADPFTDPLDWAVEISFATAMLLAAVALATLTRTAAGAARIAWGAAAAGAAAVGVAATATAVVGEETLDAVLLLGLLALVLGYLTALVLDLRGRVRPRRAGVVLFLSLLASMVLEPTGAGGLVLAAGWIGLSRLAEDEDATPHLEPEPVVARR